MFGDEELGPPPKHARRRILILLLALVLAVAGAGIAYRVVAGGGSGVAITVSGAKVADPAAVLATAEADLRAYVHGRHGVLGTTSRCYFERLSSPRTRASDVTKNLLCGPVLFSHGSQRRPYLVLRISVRPAAGDSVQATVAAPPFNAQPVAARPGSTLVRPDATSSPLGHTELPVPLPPPGPEGLLSGVDATYPTDLPTAPRDAVIGADDVTVTLQQKGPVTSYGTGADERSAPRGQHLFAFLLAFGGGENDSAELPDLDLEVDVGSAAPRHLPMTDGSSQFFVVATPASDTPLTLVLRDSGFVQRLDLRTGRPAPGNIAFLRSGVRYQTVTGFGSAPSSAGAVHVLVSSAQEYYFAGPVLAHPRSPLDMFVQFEFCYLTRDAAGSQGCMTFAPSGATLVPAGGSAARRVDTADGFPAAAFEVPATMRRGTLELTGRLVGDTATITLTAPLVIRFRLRPQLD